MEYGAHDFGPDFEKYVLNAIITDSSFVTRFRSIISPDAFISENNGYLVQAILDYFDEYNNIPSKEVLTERIRHGLYRDKGDITQRIADAVPVQDIDYIRDRLLSWTKWTAIERILQSHNGDSPREFADRITRAARTGDDLLFKRTSLNDDNLLSTMSEHRVKTPWNWLNDQLGGGLEIGDLAVILTVISGGKTTALVNIARHAINLGQFVVYFTFEDGERKIKRRLMQSICNATINELTNNKEQMSRQCKRLLAKRNSICEIHGLQSRRSTIDDAVSFIKFLEDEYERKVNIVITDYADRFRPHGHYTEPRHALREIFEDCKWLATQMNVVHWTARQVNKTMVGKTTISTNSAGESWGSMESPDLVLGLGKTLSDEVVGQLTLYTAKVRDAKDHQTQSLVADFERQRIYESETQK